MSLTPPARPLPDDGQFTTLALSFPCACCGGERLKIFRDRATQSVWSVCEFCSQLERGLFLKKRPIGLPYMHGAAVETEGSAEAISEEKK